jgi:hypothetical protein
MAHAAQPLHRHPRYSPKTLESLQLDHLSFTVVLDLFAATYLEE